MIMWRSVGAALRIHHHLVIYLSISDVDDVTIRDVIIIIPRGRAACVRERDMCRVNEQAQRYDSSVGWSSLRSVLLAAVTAATSPTSGFIITTISRRQKPPELTSRISAVQHKLGALATVAPGGYDTIFS